jgi:hypothetical protein
MAKWLAALGVAATLGLGLAACAGGDGEASGGDGGAAAEAAPPTATATVTVAAVAPQIATPVPHTPTPSAAADTPVPTATPDAGPAAIGPDFGDAPDGADAEYPIGPVEGQFPSLAASGGARIDNAGIDFMGAEVTAEDDANVVDADGADDGLVDFTVVLTQIPAPAGMAVSVGTAEGAPAGPRYLNVLIDRNLDGMWQGGGGGVDEEWVVQNYSQDVPSGGTVDFVPPAFGFSHGNRLPDGAWMRVLLTRDPLDAAGWDGSGSFEFGEVEDYQLLLPLAGDGKGKTAAPVMRCPATMNFHGAGMLPFNCVVTNLGADGQVAWSMQRRTGGVAIIPFAPAQFPMLAGQVKVMPYMALKGEVESTWYYGARVVDPEFAMLDGKVNFGVASPGDTIVQRTGDGVPGDAIETPIELVALSLTSVEPITVEPGDGTTGWVFTPVVDLDRLDFPLPPPSLFPGGTGVLIYDPTDDNDGITLEDVPGIPHPSTDLIRHGTAFPAFHGTVGQDTIFGSNCGDDLIRGGPGDDDILGTPGDDVIIGNPGDGIVGGPDGWTVECQPGPQETWSGAVGVWSCAAGPLVQDGRFNAQWWTFRGPGDPYVAYYPRDPFDGGNFIVEIQREPGQEAHNLWGYHGPELGSWAMSGIILTNPESNCRGAIFAVDSFFDIFTEIEIGDIGTDSESPVAPDQEIFYLGASSFRGGSELDYYGIDCECGSMDRRDEDRLEVDLTGLPPADRLRDPEMDGYLLVGPQ